MKQMKRKEAVYLKKIRVMIVKMIQNLGNKMETKTNRIKAWLEKIQEMFNKDLEEIKKSQSTMGTMQ